MKTATATAYLGLVGLMVLGLTACKKSPAVLATQTSSQVKGQMAFCGRPEGSDRFDIYMLDLINRKWHNLTEKYIYQIDDAFGHSIGCNEGMRPYLVSGVAWSPQGDLLIVDAGGPYFDLPYIIRISAIGEVNKIVQQWPRPFPNLHIFESPIEFSWSPSGGKVAFSGLTGADGFQNIFVGDVSDWINSNPNTEVVQLTEEYRDWPGVIYSPSWSPDGENIAFSFNGYASGIGILSAGNNQPVYINDDTSKYLSFVNKPASPWINAKPSWFPDGSSVVFLAAKTFKDRTALFKVDKDGQNLKLLISKGVRNPVVSPDGQYIAYIEYASNYELGTIGRIIRVDADGKNRQILETIKVAAGSTIFDKYYIRDMSWYPDGKWLVFTSNLSGLFQIYLVSVDGNTYEHAFDFPGDAVYPQLRPNNNP